MELSADVLSAWESSRGRDATRGRMMTQTASSKVLAKMLLTTQEHCGQWRAQTSGSWIRKVRTAQLVMLAEQWTAATTVQARG